MYSADVESKNTCSNAGTIWYLQAWACVIVKVKPAQKFLSWEPYTTRRQCYALPIQGYLLKFLGKQKTQLALAPVIGLLFLSFMEDPVESVWRLKFASKRCSHTEGLYGYLQVHLQPSYSPGSRGTFSLTLSILRPWWHIGLKAYLAYWETCVAFH